jgi:hypothetical protein
MLHWKQIAHHRDWTYGATITESYNVNDESVRRYTATIRGWGNWKIMQGRVTGDTVNRVRSKVESIRLRIDANDESVYTEPNVYMEA